MHSHTLADWRHDHVFLGAAHDRRQMRARTFDDDGACAIGVCDLLESPGDCAAQ